MIDYRTAPPRFAVAPMMDWTDRHCRFFHRQLSDHALLYTEMVVADALVHGDVARHLGFDASEHPLALQLGGSEPDKLAHCARLAESWGYGEVNLNVGCPSDRVQSGTFGACLMREPALVARCVAAMRAAVSIPITVKCRIGVDDQDTEIALDTFADAVFAEGVDALWVHARKAWLNGLSPKQNRDVPPLDYERVRRLKARYPDCFIGINGGLDTLAVANAEMGSLDGVMLGRAAYHTPAILADVDARFFERPERPLDTAGLRDAMTEYAHRHVGNGGKVGQVTRHMLGLFHGRAGARTYRRIMTVDAAANPNDTGVIARAFAAVELTNAANGSCLTLA